MTGKLVCLACGMLMDVCDEQDTCANGNCRSTRIQPQRSLSSESPLRQAMALLIEAKELLDCYGQTLDETANEAFVIEARDKLGESLIRWTRRFETQTRIGSDFHSTRARFEGVDRAMAKARSFGEAMGLRDSGDN